MECVKQEHPSGLSTFHLLEVFWVKLAVVESQARYPSLLYFLYWQPLIRCHVKPSNPPPVCVREPGHLSHRHIYKHTDTSLGVDQQVHWDVLLNDSTFHMVSPDLSSLLLHPQEVMLLSTNTHNPHNISLLLVAPSLSWAKEETTQNQWPDPLGHGPTHQQEAGAFWPWGFWVRFIAHKKLNSWFMMCSWALLTSLIMCLLILFAFVSL